MAALGGASRRAADWRFTVQGVLLARPETLRRSSDDIWSYAVELHHVVFAAEIRRVEEAAAATPAEPSSSAAAAAAAAAQGGQAPAALVAPVGAADAGEDDASDLDQATTVRVQRALNARNLGAGVPDGVAGPRMRDAIRAYQRSLGEPQTGELTGSQLRRLLGSGSG
jgi:peptidoglycan hydrolase-like protein with peptidoglycan-binding domain